ncbi:MAG: hypothetical protein L6W00_21760 [Lentisphaeria bacterium]|nr:MAG: hypothetical protein L6W00_21760 [Lentisphaeria bacterium]
MAILNHLGNRNGGATQAELAAELDITPEHLLSDTADAAGGGFRPQGGGGALRSLQRACAGGAQTFRLHGTVQRGSAGARPSCGGDRTLLQTLDSAGRDQVSILRAESPRPMAVSGKIGVHFPIIEGSVGAALLADASTGEIRELAAGCAVPVAERNHAELVLAGWRQSGGTVTVSTPGRTAGGSMRFRFRFGIRKEM